MGVVSGGNCEAVFPAAVGSPSPNNDVGRRRRPTHSTNHCRLSTAAALSTPREAARMLRQKGSFAAAAPPPRGVSREERAPQSVAGPAVEPPGSELCFRPWRNGSFSTANCSVVRGAVEPLSFRLAPNPQSAVNWRQGSFSGARTLPINSGARSSRPSLRRRPPSGDTSPMHSSMLGSRLFSSQFSSREQSR